MSTGITWPAWAPWLAKAGLLAVLLFWVVGAYNRLVRLRGGIGVAWAQIDEVLVRRSALLMMLADALHEPLVDESMTLSALVQAEQRQRAAAQAVKARPSHAPALMSWALAEAELASPMARLQALLEQRPELSGSETVAPLQRQLAELTPRLAYARQLFSDAARSYSDAVGEFPTRLVARLFGMRPTPGI